MDLTRHAREGEKQQWGLKEIALYWGLYAFVCVCLRERERCKVCVRERHGIY
jgi:hypothetical protein